LNDDIAFTKVKLPWGWLSNMSPHGVTNFDGQFFPTAEHLFQALRLPCDHPAREDMLSNRNPMRAKLIAKSFVKDFIIEPLSSDDLMNMRYVISQKINRHSDLKYELISSGNRLIVEDVSARATKGAASFWGAAKVNGQWVGENKLGRLWMELRSEICS